MCFFFQRKRNQTEKETVLPRLKEKITIFTFGLLGLIIFGSLGLIYEYNFLFYVIFFVTITGYFLFFIRTSFSSPSSSFNFFKKNNLIGFLMFVAFYIGELIL